MLTSLALIFLIGLAMAFICRKIRLPRIIGMLVTGIVLGPYVLDFLDPTILGISSELRQIALIIILIKAGLSLNISDLKKVGRPALLMCFVPACFEMIGTVILAPIFLGITRIEAAVMGAVIAAVSPAVVVPKMLNLMENGYVTDKSIPQLILAGASVDDVFVIVLFSSFADVAKSGAFHPEQLIRIPTSIIFGLLGGTICGIILSKLFKKIHIRDSIKVVLILSISFLLVALDGALKGEVGFSGLLAVMSMSAAIQKTHKTAAVRLSSKYSKLWVAAEVLLFVLVGATVNIKYLSSVGLKALLTILSLLSYRFP